MTLKRKKLSKNVEEYNHEKSLLTASHGIIHACTHLWGGDKRATSKGHLRSPHKQKIKFNNKVEQWPAVYYVHCAICSVKCAVCTAYCAVCYVYCTVFSVKCALCSVKYRWNVQVQTMSRLQCALLQLADRMSTNKANFQCLINFELLSYFSDPTQYLQGMQHQSFWGGNLLLAAIKWDQLCLISCATNRVEI